MEHMTAAKHTPTRVSDQKDGNPGHLYCAVVLRDSGEGEYESFEGLYWLDGYGDLYASGGPCGEDDMEPAYPEYDYLVEQEFAFDASYARAALKAAQVKP